MNFFDKSAYAFFIDDLSEHIDLEEQLRQEQEKYRAATEGANLRVYEYDIRSHTIILPEHVRADDSNGGFQGGKGKDNYNSGKYRADDSKRLD